jgi:hypothetical protein
MFNRNCGKEFEIRNCNSEFGIRNSEFGISNAESQTENSNAVPTYRTISNSFREDRPAPITVNITPDEEDSDELAPEPYLVSRPLPPSPSPPLPKSPLPPGLCPVPSALCSVPCALCPQLSALFPVWTGGEGNEKGGKGGEGKRGLEEWDLRDGIFEGMGEKGARRCERREARGERRDVKGCEGNGEWRDGRWERA